MNRLEAAGEIRRNRLVIDTLAGNRFYENAFTSGEKRSIMTYKEGTDSWTRLTWKQMLAMIRGYYPRRGEGQCGHRYVVWRDDWSRSPFCEVRCTVAEEHFHCKACGSSETATMVCRDLCFECQKAANKERYDLTCAILDFEMKYSITFHQDVQLRDQADGNVYESSYHGHRGEDFHADG